MSKLHSVSWAGTGAKTELVAAALDLYKLAMVCDWMPFRLQKVVRNEGWIRMMEGFGFDL